LSLPVPLFAERKFQEMEIEQIYTGCLAHGAYYIKSEGEAAIIDPLREVQPYLDRAAKDGVTIKYVFETHFHADFVSGHLDLMKKSGAAIIYGPTAAPSFEAIIAKDGEIFKVGKATVKVLHTPGHTLESSCFLVSDENGKETALFSGDTLFLGDVGRPDLAQKAANMTQEELAGLLYESIYTKILPLADEITVYPGHGAGSACGKNMIKETVDSLGHQKKTNYALNQTGKTSFIKAVTEGLLPPPGYFGMNVSMNKKGYESFDDVLQKGLKSIAVKDFEAVVEIADALVLDVREASEFAKGFVPRAINIGLKGDFAPWVGALIVDVKKPLVIVCNEGAEKEAVTRLARVGFDHVIGYLSGGFEAWKKAGKEIDSVDQISADQLESEFKLGECIVIDVRKDSEYLAEHLEEAYSRPLSDIGTWVSELTNDPLFYLHCAGGYRSMIAASVLKSHGIHNFREVAGGLASIVEAGMPTTNYVCQTKVFK
jgi:glyoxylase-like metal-dependent hydrolase (beta-lactamase superfamily II)/rhodanese-related sulfurtransferase